jgi:menaquinone-dependent protoporphyrinogen IX oxidase
MPGIIIYKGKYGATKQYATWLGEELDLPIAEAGEVDRDEFVHCDFVVLGTSVYFGKFILSKWMRRNSALLKGKKIFLFTVNATSPYDIKARDKIIQQNLPQEIKIKCQRFFLPGRIIHENSL